MNNKRQYCIISAIGLSFLVVWFSTYPPGRGRRKTEDQLEKALKKFESEGYLDLEDVELIKDFDFESGGVTGSTKRIWERFRDALRRFGI